jgi:hypothetical protein
MKPGKVSHQQLPQPLILHCPLQGFRFLFHLLQCSLRSLSSMRQEVQQRFLLLKQRFLLPALADKHPDGIVDGIEHLDMCGAKVFE